MSERNLAVLALAVSKHYLKPEQLPAILAAWEQDKTCDLLARLGRDRHVSAADWAALRDELKGHEFGRFEFRWEIGSGGQATIHNGIDREFNRLVALKRCLRKEDSPAARRLRREYALLSHLDHPGVPPVFGHGTDEAGHPFFAMRFIEGHNLYKVVEGRKKDWESSCGPRQREAELRTLLALFSRACRTVAHAHRKKVVHRDLSPANLMLTWHLPRASAGESPIDFDDVVVIDWGLGKLLEDNPALELPTEQVPDPLTMAGPCGTAAYLSPEQAHDASRVTVASDVYTLGAVLYYLITWGQLAFPANEFVFDTFERVKKGHFRPPNQCCPETPAPLAQVCLKAMSLAPAERYASADELAQDVENWLAGERVGVWGEPLAEQARRWLQKATSLLTDASLPLASEAYESVLKVAERHRDALPAGLDLAQGFHSLGLLHNARQRPEEAEAAYDKALSLWQARVEKQPDDADARDGLCKSLNNLVAVYRHSKRHQLALDAASKAVEQMRALADGQPANAGYRDGLVVGLLNLGSTYLDLGRPEEADTAFSDAVTEGERVVAAEPRQSSYRLHLAAALERLGWVHARRGEAGKAQEVYDRWLAELQKLVEQSPAVTDHARILGIAHQRLAGVAGKLGQPEQVESHLANALRVHVGLREQKPAWALEYTRLSATLALELGRKARFSDALTCLDLALKELSSHPPEQTREMRRQLALNAGLIHTQSNAHDKALAAWDEALSLGEQQGWLRFQRALSQARLGRCDDAETLAREWQQSGDPQRLDWAGCIFAQCATFWLRHEAADDAARNKKTLVATQQARESAACFLAAVRGGQSPSLPAAVLRDDAAFRLVQGETEYLALLESMERHAP